MKSKLLLVVLSVVIFFPTGVNAASIKSASISSFGSEQEVGSYFYVPFDVSFSGLANDLGGNSGVFLVMLGIQIDDSVLKITNILSDFYDSNVYKDGDTYYILSIVNTNFTDNKCRDQFLACTDYQAKIQFYLKSDVVQNTDIKLIGVIAGAFSLDPTFETYTLENMEQLEFEKEISKTISVKKAEKQVVIDNSKNSIVIEHAKPEIKNEIIENSKENSSITSNSNHSNYVSNVARSSNANLKSIVVDDYEIDFKADRLYYELTIDQDVSSLIVKVETEDDKATYQVIGADSLQDEVDIIVKAENGTEQTYVIQILRNSENIVDNLPKNQDSTHVRLDYIIVCGLPVIVAIIISSLVISYLRNRKIDKMLNKL
ncbi:MAG: cadherin-like beta sandwich domain-containing protein [bacterium]|nr:cadherin-like beta sandwich domain-containing protein [bacterium]